MGIDATIIGQMKSQKGKSECLPWDFVKKFLPKCEDEEWVFNVFAMAVYEMVIFLKVPNHIKAAVVNLVEQVNNQADLVLSIIAETICSLNFCHKKDEGQFIKCVQLQYIWIRSHFWGKYTKSLKHLIDTFVPINEFLKQDWLMHQTRKHWVVALRNQDSDSITWKAPWLSRKFVL